MKTGMKTKNLVVGIATFMVLAIAFIYIPIDEIGDIFQPQPRIDANAKAKGEETPIIYFRIVRNKRTKVVLTYVANGVPGKRSDFNESHLILSHNVPARRGTVVYGAAIVDTLDPSVVTVVTLSQNGKTMAGPLAQNEGSGNATIHVQATVR